MQIRVYCPSWPFPPNSGGAQVVAGQVCALLAEGHEVELAVTRDMPTDTSSHVPEGVGTVQLRPGHRVAYVLAGILSLLSGSATPELYYYPPAGRWTRVLGPVDLAIYHYSFARRVLQGGELPEERRRVVHLHNLEAELFEILSRSAGFGWSWGQRRNARRLERAEAQLPRLVDELWFVSAVDLERYTSKYRSAKARLVPPVFTPDIGCRSTPPPSEKLVLGFVGALDFPPNQASLSWILGPPATPVG